MKIHLCCGDIYLEGYVNTDIKGKLWKKAQKLNPNFTTLDCYYKDRAIGQRREILVDKMMNITKKWTFRSNSVDEIVMICALEHVTQQQAKFIMSEAFRVLKAGGRFLLDFPDMAETFKQYYTKDPEYYMRLVYCNHSDEFSVHKFGYTTETFSRMAYTDLKGKYRNWKNIYFRTIVKHNYPMIGVVLTK